MSTLHKGFTPGPWFYGDGEGGKYFPHVVLGGANPKAGHYIVVNTTRGGNGGLMSECQANARLIADAPNLLAQLERTEAALRELLDATPTSCDDRRLNEAQKRAEELLRP